MIRFAADENFSGVIVRALKLRRSELDIVRVQDTDVAGSDDPTLLAGAAQEQRIILTQHTIKAPFQISLLSVSTRIFQLQAFLLCRAERHSNK